MKRSDLTWLAVVLAAAGAMPLVCAAKPKSLWPLTPATDQEKTGAAPASAVTSIEGVVAGRYPYGTPQRLLVAGEHGKEWLLMIDPSTTSMSKEKKPATLADLRDGDRVKVAYLEKNGTPWIQSLEAAPALQPPSAPSMTRDMELLVSPPVSAPTDMPTTSQDQLPDTKQDGTY